jgi:hypothetical protein
VDEEGDDAVSVPLVREDEIADTIYEGEELESEERSTEELKGSLQRVQAVALGRHGDSKNISMPAEGKVVIPAQARLVAKPVAKMKAASRASQSGAVAIAEVKTIVDSLSQVSEPIPSAVVPGRPRRAAAPIAGQFHPDVQNIQILDMDALVPISPPVKRKRKARSKK